MNVGTPPITTLTAANGLVGQVVTETASIAYDGTLLPADTASYEIKLKELL